MIRAILVVNNPSESVTMNALDEIRFQKYVKILLKGIVLIVCLFALIGLSALAFFLAEQALLELGISSWLLVYGISSFSAGLIFVSHLLTWVRASLEQVDRCFGNDLSPELTQIKKELYPQYRIYYNLLMVISFIGIVTLAANAYLGFLSFASVIGVTGASLIALKQFAVVCCMSMLVSASSFSMRSASNEFLLFVFRRKYLKKQKLSDVFSKQDECLKTLMDTIKKEQAFQSYRKRGFAKKIFSGMGWVLGTSNALSDVIFKSFAFYHLLMFLGLVTTTSLGLVTVSKLGLALLLLASMSTFVVCFLTEGYRIIAISREYRKYRYGAVKRKIIEDVLNRKNYSLKEIGHLIYSIEANNWFKTRKNWEQAGQRKVVQAVPLMPMLYQCLKAVWRDRLSAIFHNENLAWIEDKLDRFRKLRLNFSDDELLNSLLDEILKSFVNDEQKFQVDLKNYFRKDFLVSCQDKHQTELEQLLTALKIEKSSAVARPQKENFLNRHAIGPIVGNTLVMIVSFANAVPVFTSSLSKTAGLYALIIILFPGAFSVATFVSVGLGIFFAVAKFMGYFAQSGPHIVEGIETLFSGNESNESSESYIQVQDGLGQSMPDPENHNVKRSVSTYLSACCAFLLFRHKTSTSSSSPRRDVSQNHNTN